jgi:aromatic ring hydroxylase
MLRTAEQYLAGLRDGREVYYRGVRVPDVTTHESLGMAARHAAIDFRLAEDPHHRDLALASGESEPYSFYFHLPRTPDDLRRRSLLIEAATAEAGTLVVLIKEIGSDAIFALTRVLSRSPEDRDLMQRVRSFHERCRNEDLALAVAQTDAKGQRRLGPSQQVDPDLYLRVVDRDKNGIVVRGAKLHTSCAPYVDWLIVLPGRSMGPGDEQWSLSFAVPVESKGLKLYASDFLHGEAQPFTLPISSRHRMVETLTVFDDVFVPWDQVFFSDRPDLASQAALGFVEYHRFTAVSYKLPLLDALVGSAIAAARANGIEGASHVRDKLTWLIGYAESVRALIELAAIRCRHEGQIAYPDVLTTNLAKWVFARDIHQAFEKLQDIAGGLLVTGPSDADWASPAVRPMLDKYLAAAWPAGRRMAVLNLISELTSRTYGGYQAALAVHAEGSLEAEKLAIYRAYDPAPAIEYALQLAGVPPETDGLHDPRPVTTAAIPFS